MTKCHAVKWAQYEAADDAVKTAFFAQPTLHAFGISSDTGTCEIPAPIVDIIIKEMIVESREIVSNVEAFLTGVIRRDDMYIVQLSNMKQFEYVVSLLRVSLDNCATFNWF